MSRSGYSEDCEHVGARNMWRGAVKRSIEGRRGQALLVDALAALDDLPEKRLTSGALSDHEGYCLLGAVGERREIDLDNIDDHDPYEVARAFNVAPALAQEIAFVNDEGAWRSETPEQRFDRMRHWVKSLIKVPT